MRTTLQVDPADGGRRRAPGVGQTLAIAGSIAAVIAGMFGLASTEHDSPDAADYRTTSMIAAAPAVAPPRATVVAASDPAQARPYAVPAPLPATPGCSTTPVGKTWPTESAPAHGLARITAPKPAAPPVTTGSAPPASAAPAKPCGTSTTVSAPANVRGTAHPARPAKPHPAAKPATQVPAKPPVVKPKPTVKH